MYLLIDASQKDLNHLVLFDEEHKKEKNDPRPNRELLHSLDDFLMEEEIPKEDIAGIMIVVGAGSFTSTRLSATIANMFSFVKQIPILPISEAQIGEAESLIPKLLAEKGGQYVSPTYSAEANIGKKHV